MIVNMLEVTTIEDFFCNDILEQEKFQLARALKTFAHLEANRNSATSEQLPLVVSEKYNISQQLAYDGCLSLFALDILQEDESGRVIAGSKFSSFISFWFKTNRYKLFNRSGFGTEFKLIVLKLFRPQQLGHNLRIQ